jgi:predicted metal-dependent hydrolase
MSRSTRIVKVNPRVLSWEFAEGARKYWFDGSPALTHFLNTYTLLVPDNERYYIRALTPCVARLADPEQRTELMQFFRQESLHGIAHQKYWTRMEQQGCRVRPFVTAVDVLLYRLLEPLQPARLKVAIVAAIEHINAVWGHVFLSRGLLAPADTTLRELFSWHLAEEIEHKAVAHRALQALYPGYLTRALGALLAFPLFHLIVIAGTVYLLAGDGELFRRRTVRDLARLWWRDGFVGDTLRHLGRYLRPSFEPWELDDLALSARTLERLPARPAVIAARSGHAA